MKNNPTTWEALAIVIGPAWAEKVWPVVRDRPDLPDQIIRIQPRLRLRINSDGSTGYVDANARVRAHWIDRACEMADAAASTRD